MAVDLLGPGNRVNRKLDVARVSRILKRINRASGVVVESEGPPSGEVPVSFDQDFLPFAVKLASEERRLWYYRGSNKRVHQSRSDHIVRDPRIGIVCVSLLCGTSCHAPGGFDNIDFGVDQLRRILRNQINVEPKIALMDREVSALNEAAAAQSVDTSQWHNRISKWR